MHKETFYLDGIDARSVGIQLQRPIEFSEAVPVIEAETIPGRNGDLIYYTGSYENRSATAECFCLEKDVKKALRAAGRFLMNKRGYRRLETNDDPDHFWLAVVENSPGIEQRMRLLAPFEIGFDCKPQAFLKNGEDPIIFTENGSLFNQYGQTALPFITVYGEGIGSLVIGDCEVAFKDIGGMLYLDSDIQNAYNINGNQNANIIAPVFPTLPDGETNISFFGGIQKVEITPRWWEL